MHAISHTLAHRAPPASRTRARWQPYSSLPTYSNSVSACSSGSKSSSPTSYTTPATSIASPLQPTPACDISPEKPPIATCTPAVDSLRDASCAKNKFALGLVDQAVKTLCEVWRPQDIPVPFTNPRTIRVTDYPSPLSIPPNCSLVPSKHTSLPATHTASSSIPTTPTQFTFPCPTATPVLIQPGTSQELRNLVPVRGFVHEVLRRSRTSGCVLQTALCYLEAIRPKIPELAHLERIGKGTNGEPETVSRIIKATEEEIERSRQEEALEQALGEGEATVRFGDDEHDVDAMDTLKIDDDCDIMLAEVPSRNQYGQIAPMDTLSSIEETEIQQSLPTQTSSSMGAQQNLAPLPPLPTPLLCPRRAFLAALILASKFTQDKCYSNRAWAKLSGLPPREIGRCERALGSALEWRLWVGKAASSAASTSPSATPVQRPVIRCQSETSLRMATTTALTAPFCAPASSSPASMPELATATAAGSSGFCGVGNRRFIRRSSTLPDGLLADSLQRSQSKQFLSHPSDVHPPFDFSSSTLVQADTPNIPSVYLHGPSSSGPAPASVSSGSPSPEMPGLSYSPSSASSSPSSCSSLGDRTQPMAIYFEDPSAAVDYFDSPVARVNTRLLVPGFTSGLGAFGSSLAPLSGKGQPPPGSHFLRPIPLTGLQNGIPAFMTAPDSRSSDHVARQLYHDVGIKQCNSNAM